MSSNRLVLDQFKSATPKTMSCTKDSAIIAGFKTNDPVVYATNITSAQNGDINALACVAMTYIESNKPLAFEMFNTAIESAKEHKEHKAAGELAYAIATVLKDPKDKAKYYYQAILAEGHLRAFKELKYILPGCASVFLEPHGFYYAFFAYQLLSEPEKKKIQDYYWTEYDTWDAQQIYGLFREKDPENYKIFFIQRSLKDLKKAIGQHSFVQKDFDKYQNELVDYILKDLVKTRGDQLCLDNLNGILLPYKNQYHADYFVDIQNRIKQRIVDIENNLVPVFLTSLQGSVDSNITMLAGKDRSKLQPQEQTNIAIQLKAFIAVQEALQTPDDEKAIIVLTSKPSAPLLSRLPPEDCIGPAADEKDNNTICIKFTKKYINVMQVIQRADAEIQQKRDRNGAWLAWSEFVESNPLALFISGGVAIFTLFGTVMASEAISNMPAALMLSTLGTIAGILAACVAVAAVTYLVVHYNHPATKAVRDEKAAARKAYGFFEKQLLNNFNVTVAPTLPTVSTHLQACAAH